MDEKEKIERAKYCNTCLDWINICEAECCKMFNVSLKYCVSNPKCDFTKKYVTFKIVLTPDMQWYIRLKGCMYSRGFLRVNSKYCCVKGDLIYIYKDCEQLKNNLCTGHPNHKPKVCRELTLETVNTMENIVITPNCLFKYKSEGMKHENN